MVYGSKAVGEPPLMLAFSVREALREAVGAFGAAGSSVELASPATPEAVFWAVEAARAAVGEGGRAGDGDRERDGVRPAHESAGGVGATTDAARTLTPFDR